MGKKLYTSLLYGSPIKWWNNKRHEYQTYNNKLYLDVVTKFFARRPHCMPDPCANNLCKWSPLIDKILKEHLRWQTMPKRRNPITKAMIQHWISKAKLEHQDSFISALSDWMILGHYEGFRKSEWIQDNSVYTINIKKSLKI